MECEDDMMLHLSIRGSEGKNWKVVLGLEGKIVLHEFTEGEDPTFNLQWDKLREIARNKILNEIQDVISPQSFQRRMF